MSILIKGMEMPTNCCRCPCADLEYYDCNLMPGTGISSDRKSGKRRDDCPLVPVPPHGDLIDRDGAVRDLRMDYAYAAARIVSLQPVIIPAEPPKEEA